MPKKKDKEKEKGMFSKMFDSSKADKERFTRSVTEGKEYESLYDIGSAIRRIDSGNLMVGVVAVMIGLLIFMFSIILPFLYGHGFRLGFWTAIGMMILLSGLFYYIGSFRILHPLSKAVAVERDRVIRGILKTRMVCYEDAEANRRLEEETESDP